MRTPEWFEDKLFSEQGMSVLCIWEREGREVPLPLLSVRCRAEPGQVGTVLTEQEPTSVCH